MVFLEGAAGEHTCLSRVFFFFTFLHKTSAVYNRNEIKQPKTRKAIDEYRFDGRSQIPGGFHVLSNALIQ